MKKNILYIDWMHCRSCELNLEKSISEIAGIKKVSANQRNWELYIEYDDSLDMSKLDKIILDKWYKVWKKQLKSWISHDLELYIQLVTFFVIILFLYVLLGKFWFDIQWWEVWMSPTLWIILLIWLTAWFSSCMAMVWWLILAISSNLNKHKHNLSVWEKFYPHIYFNIGRILWFTIFGAILGGLGSLFDISIIVIWVFTLIVWWVMFMLWINLTEISPRLSNISITLPKFMWKNISGNADSKLWAVVVWAMTFFLPCWFTLAIQMYAMSSWSFFMWAMIMWVFAIWTSLWLIGIWWLTSIFKWYFAKMFFRFVWVLVICLAVFNISNGLSLLKGWPTTINNNINKIVSDEYKNLEIQEIKMDQLASWYSPNKLKISSWKKIRWIINSKSPYGCSSWIVVPDLWINKQLVKWENIIEFVVPDWVSEINFSCIMWMYNGKFIIDNWNK